MMTFATVIGLIVIYAVMVTGVYWILTNITFNRPPEPYTYERKDHEVKRDKNKTNRGRNVPKA
jgi:hypothetical protein